MLIDVFPQQPPRITFWVPVGGPVGLVVGLVSLWSLYQSEHHSQTLPCRSNRPKGLGVYDPTGVVRAGELAGASTREHSPSVYTRAGEIFSWLANADSSPAG